MLSYEQAFRAGKRQQKTAKERILRKLLTVEFGHLIIWLNHFENFE